MENKQFTAILIKIFSNFPADRQLPTPLVLPHPREDGPPPPPGGRLPSDGPPPPWGTALPPDTHIFRHRNCTAKRKDTVAGLSCLQAHRRCGDMHHCALNIQRPSPKQVSLWTGWTLHLSQGCAVKFHFSESEQNVLPRVQGIQEAVPHNTDSPPSQGRTRGGAGQGGGGGSNGWGRSSKKRKVAACLQAPTCTGLVREAQHAHPARSWEAWFPCPATRTEAL